MATLSPLEFDLSGFEQYKTPARAGVRGAADAEQLRRVIEAGRTRAAAAAAPAPSMPLPDNPAPVATSTAASAPSFGRRVLNAGKMLGRASLPATAGLTAMSVGEFLIPDKAAVGMADIVGRIGRALGIQSLAQYAGGSQQVAQAAAPPAEPGPVPPAVAPPLPAPVPPVTERFPANPRITTLPPGAAAEAASRFIDGSGAPADRTGYIRNESTGAVIALDSRDTAPRMARYVQPRAEVTKPALGTEGGIFGNLVQFVNDYAATALPAAARNRSTKTGLKTRELDIRETDSQLNRETQAENAESNRMRAVADILKEVSAANKDNKRVVQGIDGNPIVVDLKANSAAKITPTERPTMDRFLTEARKEPRNKGVSDAQLRAYYSRTYGG